MSPFVFMVVACTIKNMDDCLWAGKTRRPVTEKGDECSSFGENRGAWGRDSFRWDIKGN
jgi:hypothetical protein